MRTYYVYILASKARGTLYVGVTDNLLRRNFEHSSEMNQQSFTKRYDVKRLVYYETTNIIHDAIKREKQLKNWHRQWKINLIESVKPKCEDLRKKYRMDPETSSGRQRRRR